MHCSLNYSGTLGFCPQKIKITQFPDGFCLNLFSHYITHTVPKQVTVSQADPVFMKIYAAKVT